MEKWVKLPKLTSDNLSSVMAERIDAAKNDHTVIPMLWQGMIEMDIHVEGVDRTVKLYIPKDTPQGTTFILMNVPQGEDAVSFLEKSGWREKADKEGFCLFVLEPGAEGWGTVEQELNYLRAAFITEIIGQYFLPGFAMYVVGYGEIGTGLHQVVMSDPLYVAAAVFLDAGKVEESYLEEYKKKVFDHDVIRGMVIPREYNVPYREVPVPVWIASEKLGQRTLAAAEYWKSAACADEGQEDEMYGIVYRQGKDMAFTPGGRILKVAVQEKKYDYSAGMTTERIYNFLRQFYRYGMGPCSNMISQKVDYKAMGVEHKMFTDRNGIDREYLVYVPEDCRDSVGKYPLILAFHGASQSMRNMFENGMWYRIADREKLIIAVPESTLIPLPDNLKGGMSMAYRPLWQLENPELCHTDADYAAELLDRLVREYPVDEQRIYCSGHSMGCMMTNYLGSTEVGHRFAAVGATSGILAAREFDGTQKIPAFLTIGEYDMWSYQITEDSPLTDALDMWLIKNGLAAEENVHEVRTAGAAENWVDGRHNSVWKDDKGIPWLRFTWVARKQHSHTFYENDKLWHEFFSKWHIGEDGSRYYQNK